MKRTVLVISACAVALAGCVTRTHQAHVWPEWADIKGKTNSEIAEYLYQKGDRTMEAIHEAKALLEERRALLIANPTEEAQAEVARIDGQLKALTEQAIREAKLRFDQAFSKATEKKT